MVTDGGFVQIDGGTVPLVELGTGTNHFVPLEAGAVLPIIAGPQGGHHLWAALRVYPPLAPDGLSIRLRVLHEGATLSDIEYRLNLVERGAAFEWYAMTALIPDPDRVVGSEVVVSLDVMDTAGRTGSDSRRVVPQRP